MEESIEKHLVDKLDKKLESNSKVKFHGRLQKLVKLLNKVMQKPSHADRSLIRKELYRLNNVYEECQMLSKKTIIEKVLSPSIVQISSTLDNIGRELNNVNKAEPPYRPPPKKTEPYHESSRHVDPSRIYGRDNEGAALERMLLQPGKSSEPFNAITVIGVQGVGKTTLAQLVFNKETVKAHFLPRIWVSMPRQPEGDESSTREAIAPNGDESSGEAVAIALNRNENSRREAIAKKLLTHLGVKEDIIQSIESKGLPGLLYALHLQLIGKRYLIVLDDAWDEDKWYEKLGSAPGHKDEWGDRLAYGLPKGYGGSVIITSRWEKVGNAMVGRANVIRLQPLTDQESCWKIFKDEVDMDKRYSEPLSGVTLEKLGPEVKKRSGGLPSAAKAMGQILFQKLKAEAMGKHDHDRIEEDDGDHGYHQRQIQE